ncbi:putative membrane protein YphA (DoxX/SURF4 family) [Antricoccus suffuscus]|uniref:Putative membrane protein YphA (DoxX/SURF4 family) n=1 Tax=Antricoccus suffuscus TaxID=1629062 RepID=A0A2T1A4J2_9ACTN|nr:MauE/DoxX family redox-associated membrane protein [Antricoccus suffuscus]PRZ43521.1 putative membrane protein YphA (DoxX/SURF4 family) [Antricoccus suffuscus]
MRNTKVWSRRVQPGISTLLRVVMGVVFLIAGVSKLENLAIAELSVKSYELLPNDVASVVGIVLPILEVALAVLLLLGIGIRVTAIVLSLMLVAFIIGIGSLWARGIVAQCGCFGGTLIMTKAPSYPLEIARDSLMLLATIWLVIWPRTFLSIDGWLARRSTDSDDLNEITQDEGESKDGENHEEADEYEGRLQRS